MGKSFSSITSKMKNVSENLQDIETEIKNCGFNPPITQPDIFDIERIHLPTGYIRPVKSFIDEYKLNEFINDKTIISNIAYALQYSDLCNYFINRFNIGLSIGMYFKKYATINLFSIFESIAMGCLSSLHSFCYQYGTLCKKNNNCQYYIKKPNNYKFNEIISDFEKKICFLNDQNTINMLLSIKAKRDKIHIWLCDSNELKTNDNQLYECNRMILILNTIKTDLPSKVQSFFNTRTHNCSKKKHVICNSFVP